MSAGTWRPEPIPLEQVEEVGGKPQKEVMEEDMANMITDAPLS
jgi:hypothetical protein